MSKTSSMRPLPTTPLNPRSQNVSSSMPRTQSPPPACNLQRSTSNSNINLMIEVSVAAALEKLLPPHVSRLDGVSTELSESLKMVVQLHEYNEVSKQLGSVRVELAETTTQLALEREANATLTQEHDELREEMLHAVESAQDALRQSQTDLAQMEQRHGIQVSQLNDEILCLREERDEMQHQVRELKAMLDASVAALKDKEALVDEAQEARARKSMLLRETKESLEQELLRMKAQFDSSRAIESETISRRLSVANRELEATNSERHSLKNKIAELEQLLQTAKEDKLTLQRSMEEAWLMVRQKPTTSDRVDSSSPTTSSRESSVSTNVTNQTIAPKPKVISLEEARAARRAQKRITFADLTNASPDNSTEAAPRASFLAAAQSLNELEEMSKSLKKKASTGRQSVGSRP